MRHPRPFLSLFLALVLSIVTFSPVLADAPAPASPLQPRQSPKSTSSIAAAPDVSVPTGVKLPTLKAVLVVGPIDGADGQWTQTEIQNMKLAEAELLSHGVAVSKFYAPHDSWDAVKAAAVGAHFFFYRGHGISDGNQPPRVGGLWLTSGYVSPETIRAELRLAKNAIVMMYGCYMAGSSSEDVTLSSTEAYRRVVQYSEPFFGAGAAGYYANWFGDAFQYFTRYLFEGRSLGNAFKAYFDYAAESTEVLSRPNDPANAVWMDKDFWDGGYKYDNAFSGQADKTLWDLYNTTMNSTLSQVVRLATPNSGAQTAQFRVTGTTSLVFHWTASLSLDPVGPFNADPALNNWVVLNTTSGQTGDPISLVLNPKFLPNGTYSATLHLHSDTLGVNQPDQAIPIQLRVADNWNQVYIPITVR